MAKYPFRVIFGAPPHQSTYVVTANDSAKAVRQAARQYRQEQAQRPLPSGLADPTRGLIRVRSLTPKKVGDQYFPRVGGRVIDGGPCATERQALDISIRDSLEIMTRKSS
jgi:hypothetical protein